MDRPFGKHFVTRSVVAAKNGMAATSHPLATQTAVALLRAGGSATDAAIAANAVLGLVEPTGCGIGGDLFAIAWDPRERKLVGLNASGRSPRGLTLAMLRDMGLERLPARGPLSVSVPGAVDGWFALHEAYGRLPMHDVLMPAIEYARQGAPVAEIIAGYWALDAAVLEDLPGFADLFLPRGRAPRAGESFANPGLADTYSMLAEQGRAAFYEGRIARRIHEFMQVNGAYLSYEDLAAHSSTWVDPVSSSYRGHEVWEMPPNNQGLTVLQMLNVLERYDVGRLGPQHPDYLHLLIEAKKLAFEDRARFYADPEHAAVPVEQLLSKAYARERQRCIDPRRASLELGAGEPTALGAGDTVYLATADADGHMVSLIQSNFRGFGSGMTIPDLGFGFQDRGELFSLDAEHANVYAPGKRPFHTIIPGFVTRSGDPWLCFGVMGADMQPQGHVQVLVNLIDFGMNLQEAGDAPRVRHEGSSDPTGARMRDGGRVLLESGFAPEVAAELERRGHRVSRERDGFGGYQAICWDAGLEAYLGASESRKDGQAAGF
ncbi:MAG TPA: gamma-glutamyltransferase [Gammaproteobacteria bacterium]|nr:gamma-glutamyltransferase [Gammaproteobacteria bacterium]